LHKIGFIINSYVPKLYFPGDLYFESPIQNFLKDTFTTFGDEICGWANGMTDMDFPVMCLHYELCANRTNEFTVILGCSVVNESLLSATMLRLLTCFLEVSKL
jgi:hypothetical protein